MAIYYCLIVATVIYSFLNKRIKFHINSGQKREWHDRTVVFFFAFLLVLLFLRSDTCGIDLSNYKYAFYYFNNNRLSLNSILTLKGSFGFELGYIALNLIVGSFANNFQLFIVVVAIISVIPVMCLYYRESENALLSIGAFLVFNLFSFYFSGLRQVIAMAFVFPIYYSVKKKKIFKFIIWVILACFFHKSAVIMLAFYPLVNMQIKKKHMILIIPLLIAIAVFNKQIFVLLTSLFGYDNATIETTGAYSILILLLLFVVYSFVCVTDSLLDQDYIGLRNILLFSLALQMFVPINNIAMRMNYYNLLLVPIMISKVEKNASSSKQKIARLGTHIMVVFFLIFYLLTISPGDALHVYPYVPLWA